MTGPPLGAAIAANLADVRSRIERAAARGGRRPDDVRLVAVSKSFGPEAVRAAVAAGQRDFGENRVQEALQKIAQLAGLEIRWHLVGHLQSNKARKAVGQFASIQSVDSVELVDRLEAVAAERGVQVDALVQVDLAGEATKFGAAPGALEDVLERAAQCRSVSVVGMMLVPPYFDDPEDVRPFFRRLRELRDALGQRGVPAAMLRELSMGMSHDFEVAIEEGATIVRVGTAIFGPRAPANATG